MPAMRGCAKTNCDGIASVTMALRYEDRVVLLRDALAQQDRNFVDLCSGHAARLKPPVGWEILDERSSPAWFRPFASSP